MRRESLLGTLSFRAERGIWRAGGAMKPRFSRPPSARSLAHARDDTFPLLANVAILPGAFRRVEPLVGEANEIGHARAAFGIDAGNTDRDRALNRSLFVGRNRQLVHLLQDAIGDRFRAG